MNESWRAVPGYPGYEASELGNIRCLLRWKSPRVLTQSPHARGYLKVGVSVLGKTKTVFVHRLVALAFVPNPGKLPHVNHLDAVKTNNNSWNLEWTSPALNSAHAKRNGLYQSGETHHHVRFTDKQIAEMRRLMTLGLSTVEVAKRFKTSRNYMYFIKTFRSRKALSAAKERGRE